MIFATQEINCLLYASIIFIESSHFALKFLHTKSKVKKSFDRKMCKLKKHQDERGTDKGYYQNVFFSSRSAGAESKHKGFQDSTFTKRAITPSQKLRGINHATEASMR